MSIIILTILFIVLDIAALRWGVNSTDNIDSPEWERRRNWDALYPPEPRTRTAYTPTVTVYSNGTFIQFPKALLN